MCIRFPLMAFAAASAMVAHSGEPDRDPKGWDHLRFGMGFRETVDALGTKAKKAGQPQQQDLTNAAIDAAVVESMATNFLEESKTKPDDVSREVTKACRDIRKILKSRIWRTCQGITHGAIEASPSPSAVVVRTAKGQQQTFDVRFCEIDRASLRALADFREAAVVVISFAEKRESEAHRKDDSFVIRDQNDLRIDVVREGGIEMQPELVFTPALSSIRLFATHEAVDTPINAMRTYDVLSKHLSNRLGPPDDAMQSENSQQKLWRFPETIVTLKREKTFGMVMQYVQSAPNMGGQTQAVGTSNTSISISYDTPEMFGVKDILKAGESLQSGDVLWSLDRRFALQLTGEGSLVLRRAATDELLWSSDTNGSGATALTVNGNGEVILTCKNGKRAWSSNTNGRRVTHLILQNDGNLVLYNDRAAVWATHTNE